jgi:hypothetical protein
MKYTTIIIINVPIKEFIATLINPENMKHWQYGLINFEHIHGTPGDVGSKMKLQYKMSKRKMELIETITHSELPHAFHLNYDTKGMHNIQENFFEEIDANKTKWTSKNEFIPTNFILRMMTLLMPGAFKKQSKKYLEDFKKFAEKGISLVNN